MKTLTTLSIAAGLAFMAATVSAQSTTPATQSTTPPAKGNMPSPDQMAQRQTNRIKQSVQGITPDQESKILAVEQEYTKGMMDAHSSSNGDHDAMHAKMESLRTDRDSKIKAILTDDQYTQYQKIAGPHPMAAPKSGN